MDMWMRMALDEAEQGQAEGGIPIGSVLVRGDRLLGRGRNKRVQQDDPILHAEIDCLRAAGRVGYYGDTTLYSTLMPCYLCAGAVVQFGIKRVVVGGAQTFPGAPDFLRAYGVDVVTLDLAECRQLMAAFIQSHPALWNEDIGALPPGSGA